MRSQITYGDGMYKSTDAGAHWQHIGLDDSQQIGKIIVDPKDANRVFVAALGHAYGPNPERGVFRSLDGGAHWEKVLCKNDDTGAIDVAFDPDGRQRALCIVVADASSTVGGLSSGEWAGQRTLQIHRRRQHLEAIDERLAHRRAGTDRHRREPQRAAARVSVRRCKRRRGLPLRRRRRIVPADRQRSSRVAAGMVFRRHHRRSEKRGRGVRRQYLDL